MPGFVSVKDSVCAIAGSWSRDVNFACMWSAFNPFRSPGISRKVVFIRSKILLAIGFRNIEQFDLFGQCCEWFHAESMGKVLGYCLILVDGNGAKNLHFALVSKVCYRRCDCYVRAGAGQYMFLFTLNVSIYRCFLDGRRPKNKGLSLESRKNISGSQIVIWSCASCTTYDQLKCKKLQGVWSGPYKSSTMWGDIPVPPQSLYVVPRA
jgi:hypothetical protein